MTLEKIAREICGENVPNRFDQPVEKALELTHMFPVLQKGAHGMAWKNIGVLKSGLINPQEGNALQQLCMYTKLNQILAKAQDWAKNPNQNRFPGFSESFAGDRVLYAIVSDFPFWSNSQEVAQAHEGWHNNDGPSIKPEHQKGVYWERMPNSMINAVKELATQYYSRERIHGLLNGSEKEFETYLTTIKTIVEGGHDLLKDIASTSTNAGRPFYERMTSDRYSEIKAGDHVYAVVLENNGSTAPVISQVKRCSTKDGKPNFEIKCTYASQTDKDETYETEFIFHKLMGV